MFSAFTIRIDLFYYMIHILTSASILLWQNHVFLELHRRSGKLSTKLYKPTRSYTRAVVVVAEIKKTRARATATRENDNSSIDAGYQPTHSANVIHAVHPRRS